MRTLATALLAVLSLATAVAAAEKRAAISGQLEGTDYYIQVLDIDGSRIIAGVHRDKAGYDAADKWNPIQREVLTTPYLAEELGKKASDKLTVAENVRAAAERALRRMSKFAGWEDASTGFDSADVTPAALIPPVTEPESP